LECICGLIRRQVCNRRPLCCALIEFMGRFQLARGLVRSAAPANGLLIGMTDAQGHGFVIAATHNLERQRQSYRWGTIWQRQGAHLQQIAEAR
jgi:hypothetical protein